MKDSRQKLFDKAISGEKTKRHLLWMMRQAGRYLPEYRELRKKYSFLEMCRTPNLAAEVSLQPLEILNVDLVIVFSDILLPLCDYGIELDFPEEGGLRIDYKEYELLKGSAGKNIGATLETIRQLKNELEKKEIPVLGFSGAPWTLLNYLLEKGSSNKFFKAKEKAWTEPKEIHSLLKRLTSITIDYLQRQISAGASAVQIFDTHAGELSSSDFENFALPYLKEIFQSLPPEVPKILYVKDLSGNVGKIADIGINILSVDSRISLNSAWEELSRNKNNTIQCLQGNLEPAILEMKETDASLEFIQKRTGEIICEAESLPCGHIMNLGHGITPSAKIENVKAFIRENASFA